MKSRQLCFLLLLVHSTCLALSNRVILRPPLSLHIWERFRCNVDCQINPDNCISEALFKDAANIMEDQGFLKAGYNLVILADCWMAHEGFLNGTLPVDFNGIKVLIFCSIGFTESVPDNRVMPPKLTTDSESQLSERRRSNIPAKPCDPNVCKLPQCFCGGNQPGDLRLEEIPQVVLITFDDAVNELNYQLFEKLFNGSRKNPNGCSIGVTFYVSHEWTDYGMVQNLYSHGHEIASHSISHSPGAENFSRAKWEEEIQGQKKFLSTYAGINYEDIRGMRAPFLQIGGDPQYSMLYDNNFTYDSSMIIYPRQLPLWPYTLDSVISHECMVPPCPIQSYPGIWEIPMAMWQNLDGTHCRMFSGIHSYDGICPDPLSTAEEVHNVLVNNFQRSYLTNRAPFGLFYHSDWFDYPQHLKGFEAFLDTLATMNDVYLVTSSQLIDWMRTPTALDKIKNFEAWQCGNRQQVTPCNEPNVCSYKFQGNMRHFFTCKPCPPDYPWIITANH